MTGRIGRAPDGRPFAFEDLPPEIPAPSPEQLGRVAIRMRFGDGTVIVQEPMSEAEARAHLREHGFEG
jgi:hypothetical protein